MKSFYQVVLGQIISLFGNAALRFALPLYLLRQTGSAALYGAVTALAMLPSLVGMLAGGVLADRCHKAKLMAVLDFATAGITGITAAFLGYAPLVPLIIMAMGALYAIQGLYQPAVRASLPLLLKPEQLVRGNAVIQTVDTIDELLGPLLGSIFLEALGLRGLLLLCGGCFAASAGHGCVVWDRAALCGNGNCPADAGLRCGWDRGAGVSVHGGGNGLQCMVFCALAGKRSGRKRGSGDGGRHGSGLPDPADRAGRVRAFV